MKTIDLKEKVNCVCWNHMFRRCEAIEPSAWRKNKCIGCTFFKTGTDFKKQTGRTYEEEMRRAKVYGRKEK